MQSPLVFDVAAHMICMLVFQFYSLVVSGQNNSYRVLVSNNGPTTLGGNTTFDATVVQRPSSVGLTALNRNETVAYWFWWKVEGSSDWIQHQKSARMWDSFKWHWSERGRKKVEVYVAIRVQTRQGSGQRYEARNTTELMVTDNIVASLVVTQDFEGNNQTVTRKDFEIGQVKLQISIHDPSKLFQLSNISCDWNFGDGTRLINSLLKKLSHNFTDIGSYTVAVKLRGWALGREYPGSTSKTLTFKANFDPYLVIQSSQGPKLPPFNPNQTLIATGPVTFEVKFKDPYHLISEVSTDWKFGGGTPSVVLNWKNRSISHTYYKENMVVLWTTVRARTKHHKLRPVILQKHLYFKEPVNYLHVNYSHSHPEKRVVAFNISCNGSVPVSFCWLVRKNCDLQSQSVCSHTVIQNKSCSLLVNHTFPNAGNYCISVGVVNQVSGINTSLTLKIPEGPTPTSSPAYSKSVITTQTIIVMVVLCCLLVAVISLVIKKWIRNKQKRTEKADFDFRNPETASVSDMTLSFGGESCLPQCRPENIPLLSKVQNGNYSDLL